MDIRTELKREYQQTPRPMGVYQIRNTLNGKVLVGVSLDLPGVLNRHRFELRRGSHRNTTLQAEWCEFGSAHFSFDILDELKPKEDSQQNFQEELALLEALWLDKLQPYGDRGYNREGKR
jgi:hypothetical protein